MPQPGAAADVAVDLPLVGRLLDEQAPDLRGLPRQILTTGWDNVIVRLGEDLVIRLPRRQLADRLIMNEQHALTALAGDLPLPVPIPLMVGRPTTYYPYAWSIVPWLDGVTAVDQMPEPAAAAHVLGRFLASLHRPAPSDAPSNPFRGVPLADRAPQVSDRITDLQRRSIITSEDAGRLMGVLNQAVVAPNWPGPAVWVHGDLHPRNILVDEGRVSAIIDFGDVHAGDPAVDATIAWYVLPVGHHNAFRHGATSMDADTWLRGRGWLVNHATAVASLATADSGLVACALTALRRVVRE